jgi:hypothetical protein
MIPFNFPFGVGKINIKKYTRNEYNGNEQHQNCHANVGLYFIVKYGHVLFSGELLRINATIQAVASIK